MYNISYLDVNAWLEPSKLALTSQSDVNQERHDQIKTQVFGVLETIFDTTLWVDEDHTPTAVQSVLAMLYAAWTYDLTYSDDAETNVYADKLRAVANLQLQTILNGTLVLIDDNTGQANTATNISGPEFFPNDLSSSMDPSDDFPSNGPPSFTMGSVF